MSTHHNADAITTTATPPSTEETYAPTADEDIDAFLREEGVPNASPLTRNDILSAVATLSYTVAITSVKFGTKMSLRRLDTLTCVEGELANDAEKKGQASGQRRATSALGWARHLYHEENSALTFLRGGWAEFGFVLATTMEESAMMLALRAVFRRVGLFSSEQPRSGLSWACLYVVGPMLVAGLLSWPLRAVRTAVMVNYVADTSLPSAATAAAEKEKSEPQSTSKTTGAVNARRYGSAMDAWKRVWQCMGLRSLLQNGLDVDMGGRVLSMALVWTVVQPVTRWFQQVAVARARAAAAGASTQSGLSDPASVAAASLSSSPLLTRLGQYRYFNLAALVVVVGAVNTLQRPFVVLRQRMALLPHSEATTASTRRGCRYASGWDCACQVVHREGVTALFAGLPLCLLTSTVVPLVVTFAGFPTAPAFSGTAV